MKHFKRVLNKLKCKELVSNTLELDIITVRVIDASNMHINNSIQKVVMWFLTFLKHGASVKKEYFI